MNKDELYNIVTQYTDVPKSSIKDDMNLYTDLGFTSFELVDMAYEIKESHDISLSDESLMSVQTVGDFLKLL